jgi:hypothetical protein
VKPADRRYLIDRSDACVIVGDKTPLPRPWQEKRGNEQDTLKCGWYGTNTGQAPMGSNIEVLVFANAAFVLGRLLRRIVLTLLLFVTKNKRFRNSALDNMSSNHLVPSRSQERLR